MELQDLLDRIDKNKKKKQEILDIDPFSLFISTYKLTVGIDKIPACLIYYLYSKFLSKNKEILPLKKIRFFTLLSKCFKRKRHSNERFYLLDKSVLKYTEDDLINSRIYEQQKQSKKKVRKRTK